MLKEEDDNACSYCVRECSHCGSKRATADTEDDNAQVVVNAFDSGNETREFARFFSNIEFARFFSDIEFARF